MPDGWQINFSHANNFETTGIVYGDNKDHARLVGGAGQDIFKSSQNGSYLDSRWVAKTENASELSENLTNCLKGKGFTLQQKQLFYLALSKLWHLTEVKVNLLHLMKAQI